ncbi:MAG TPA: RAMP superfamily CRISPR-associated protein [Anaerolineae bacterium]|nr:RAMP superfamily CRISPR-associated protein [Anaerolineae bacterium]
MTNSRWKNHRQIYERWIIRAALELDAPAHFGNGDVSAATDMPIARDAETKQPLLTGASIAGALRNYLRAADSKLAHDLFGDVNGNDVLESALLVNDALAENGSDVELRDGVAIDSKTRTVEKGKKFDIELIPAGARFPLSFELNITSQEEHLVGALAYALRGLEDGAIGLGKRKTRGLGRCHVSEWRVRRYRVSEPRELIAWLNDAAANEKHGVNILAAMGISESALPQRTQNVLSLRAEFALESSLLIRDYGGSVTSADAAHLKSRRNGEMKPIVSGTSLAGVLRARAFRIANTLANSSSKANDMIEKMFGPRNKKDLKASRVRVRETEVKNSIAEMVQTRVQIDRLTGGASNTALFSEQPLLGLPETRVYVELDLVGPQESEIGLLLLVLKDLWTGDLPLGGESSVGRGRLRGRFAELRWGEGLWRLEQQDDKLSITGDAQKLESCVSALRKGLTDAGH